MINNKFTKLAIATLLTSTMENVVTASSDNALDMQSPVRLKSQSFQVNTPKTAILFKQRVAEFQKQSTPHLLRKVEASLAGKQGRLPESVLQKLANTHLTALKHTRDISANQLEIELKAAHERALASSKALKSNSEIQALIESLESQRLEASQLGTSFEELAAEKASKEAEIQKLIAEKEEEIQKLIAEKQRNESEIQGLQQTNEYEKSVLVETLEETLIQHQSDLERLTAAQIRLQNDLYKKTQALIDSESELEALMPLVDAVRKGAATRRPSATTASKVNPGGAESKADGTTAQATATGAAAKSNAGGTGYVRNRTNIDEKK